MNDGMLDLFVLIHQEEEAEAAAKAQAGRQPQQCSHCGDWSPNGYLLSINHGIYFNGWCGRRFWANKRNNAEDNAWLQEHGFERSDPWSVTE